MSLYDKNRQTEIMYQKEGGFWGYSSPLLFPIVGGFLDDTYISNGKIYNIPNHGFARLSTFELVSADEASVCFALSQNETTLKQYPFNFMLTAEYALKGCSCIVNFIVENKGINDMPFQIGYHPAFKFNLNDIDKCYVLFDKEEKDFPYLTEGRRLDIKDIPNAVNNTFSANHLSSSYVALITNDYKIKIGIGNTNRLAIWRKTKDTPFVSIEPLVGGGHSKSYPNNIYERKGGIILQKGQCFEFKSEITCVH
jgi:galactose mutarotase-like enzyme